MVCAVVVTGGWARRRGGHRSETQAKKRVRFQHSLLKPNAVRGTIEFGHRTKTQ
jgi:hypothetical protein